jgi:hypothetical protein
MLRGMSKEQLQTASEVIDALGGNQAVGSLTERQAKTVWYWRDTGKFPANTFLTINSALLAQGKTASASLWSMKIPESAS